LRLPRGEALDAVSRESLMTGAEIRRHCRLPRPARCSSRRPEALPPLRAALAAVHRIRDVAEARHPARDTDRPGPTYLHARHPIRRRADRW